VVNGLQHVAPGIQVQAKHVPMDASNNAAVEQVAAGPTSTGPTGTDPASSGPVAIARALSAKGTHATR
jgi:hypothetical protein